MEQVVAVVRECKKDLLVPFDLHLNRVINDLVPACRLSIIYLCDCKAKILYCVEDTELARWLSHDHLHLSSLDKVQVDLFNCAEDLVEVDRHGLALQQDCRNNHVEYDWTGILLLENQICSEIEGRLVQIGLVKGSQLLLV